MTKNIDYKTTAAILTGGAPMAFKAFPDGSLVVIAHDGKKHRFTAEQVEEIQPKPDPKPKPKPSPQRKGRGTASTKTNSNKSK